MKNSTENGIFSLTYLKHYENIIFLLFHIFII